MSLVNKMLRDLDARHAGASERGTLPLAVSQLPEDDEGRGRKIALALFAMAGLGLAAAIQFGWLPIGSPDSAPVATPSLPIAVTPAIVVAAAPPAAIAPGLPVSSPLPEDPSLSLRLDDTLVRAPVASPAAEAPAAKPGAAAEPVIPAKPKPGEEGGVSPAITAAPAAAPGRVAVAPEPPLKREPKSAEVRRAAESPIAKQVRSQVPAEQADAEYGLGVLAQREGRLDEAQTRYRMALAQQPLHGRAQLALANLFVEQKRYDEAEELLKAGAEQGSRRLPFAQSLARLKAERGDFAAALEVLQQQNAAGEGSAEYQGFVAALLNRLGRHAEAVTHYGDAARLAPNDGRWWAGLGIALDAAGKPDEAREAYRKARALPGLSAELVTHVESRLK